MQRKISVNPTHMKPHTKFNFLSHFHLQARYQILLILRKITIGQR